MFPRAFGPFKSRALSGRLNFALFRAVQISRAFLREPPALARVAFKSPALFERAELVGGHVESLTRGVEEQVTPESRRAKSERIISPRRWCCCGGGRVVVGAPATFKRD